MNRRGFLKSLIGIAATAFNGGGNKLLSALATPQVAASITGYIWAPYIPILCTPTFLDPNSIMTRRKSICYGRLITFVDDDILPAGESLTDDGMSLRQRRVR